MSEDRLYSVKDAAAFLGGISAYTVNAWLSKGRLRRTKIGNRTMIRESDLQVFIDRCNPQATNDGAAGVPAKGR